MASSLPAQPPDKTRSPSWTASPGLARVSLPHAPNADGAIAADAAYGYTEAIGEDAGPHHRIAGSIAGSLSLAPWLLAMAAVQGKYDQHPADAQGSDDSWNGFPSLGVLAFTEGDETSFGARLRAELPGREAPSIEWNATTVDLEGLFAYTIDSHWTFASNVGFRLDNTAAAAPDPFTLRRGDRVALQASDHHAILASLGVAYQLTDHLFFVEGSGDWLLSGSASTFPVRATAGYRTDVAPALAFESRATASLSARPDLSPESDLIPIEPRFAVSLGLRYSFGVASGEPKTSESEPERVGPKPAEPASPRPSVPLLKDVKGSVTDASGTPLAQVELTLTLDGQSWQATTNAEGRFSFESVPSGNGTVRAETVDYEPVEQEVVVSDEGSEVVLPPIQLRLAALGAQIQGLVRTFEGKPLQATIRVTPPGAVHTSDADGRFAIDVTEGKYQVEIRAEGYVSQTHVVKVGKTAVIVVNADLRRAQ